MYHLKFSTQSYVASFSDCSWRVIEDVDAEIGVGCAFPRVVDRHYTITVAVTDFSGNTSQGTFVLSVHP